MSKTFNIGDYKPEELQHVDGRKVVGVWKLPIKASHGKTHVYQLEDGFFSFWSLYDTEIIPVPKQRWRAWYPDAIGYESPEKVKEAYEAFEPTHAINIDTLEVVKL